jgi:hypothetical protein
VRRFTGQWPLHLVPLVRRSNLPAGSGGGSRGTCAIAMPARLQS